MLSLQVRVVGRLVDIEILFGHSAEVRLKMHGHIRMKW